MIPLYIESHAYVDALEKECAKFDESAYRRAVRVNYSHRFEREFYRAMEAVTFHEGDKLDGSLSDVFLIKLTYKERLRVSVKILAHWLFFVIGCLQRMRQKSSTPSYVKCYVDDIDLVYEPNQCWRYGVFPFPLGLKRQLNFIRELMSSGRTFVLDGYPYSLIDLSRFLVNPTVGNYERLEHRAAFRFARRVSKSGVSVMRMSDEFDISFLSTCRFFKRFGVFVENRTHGVGKYLPYVKVDRFYYLDESMLKYYRFIGGADKRLFFLKSTKPEIPFCNKPQLCLVFMGQLTKQYSPYIDAAESELSQVLSKISSEFGLGLFYKPHPNAPSAHNLARAGFLEYVSPEAIFAANLLPLYISFFSSSHIEKKFSGIKLVIETEFIRPRYAFHSGRCVKLNELKKEVSGLLDKFDAFEGVIEFDAQGNFSW